MSRIVTDWKTERVYNTARILAEIRLCLRRSWSTPSGDELITSRRSRTLPRFGAFGLDKGRAIWITKKIKVLDNYRALLVNIRITGPLNWALVATELSFAIHKTTREHRRPAGSQHEFEMRWHLRSNCPMQLGGCSSKLVQVFQRTPVTLIVL